MNHNRTKSICVLGSTGSVGRQTMEVARHLGLPVRGISGMTSVAVLEEQIREFSPAFCAVGNEDAARDLRLRVRDTSTKILSGAEGIDTLAAETDADTVCNSVTGIAGLSPTLAAIRSRHTLALANKEALVTAGETVLETAREMGVSVLPVDSEHCAVFQCLNANPSRRFRRIILTASGGAFYGRDRAFLEQVTPKMALCHPTWRMGPKITVDCASLANKGLEIIEAARLFFATEEQIEVVIHRESMVHSMVEFEDGAVIMQMSRPDMRLCIQYALTYPDRVPSLTPPVDFSAMKPLTFGQPDRKMFPLLDTACYALHCGGVIPTVFNAANEVAVDAFLHGSLRFTELFDIVDDTVRAYPAASSAAPDIAAVNETDRIARSLTREAISRL